MVVQKKSVYFFLLAIVSVGLLFACNDKNEDPGSEIPNVYVNFYLQPDGIDFIPTGNWKYYNDEGYRGIIIYRVDQFNFNAFERTCPYDAQKECAMVEVDNSGVLLVDSCCMSYYSILDGMPAGGPTTLPLKLYFSEYDGSTLHVYNAP
jgi:hypothetical protein